MLCNLVTTTTLVKMAKYHVLDSKEALSENFSKFVEDLSRSSIANHGYFAIGLSGGSSATIVSNSLSSKDLEWGKWHVYFCDERFVKLSDPDSNYNSLKAIFFDKVPIPKDQIYTVDAENGIGNAALDYSKKITSLFGDSQLPKFDLLVLGMGPDGHICSLFPNHPLLDEKEKWVAFLVDSPKPPPQRITLTLPILNNAKAVCFTVTGGSKAEMIQNVKQKPLDRNIPASMVQSQEGEIHWFMDKDAAKLLA